MNPDERLLLEQTAKLSQENNKILRRLQRAYRMSLFWEFIKISLIVVPLILGYFYLQPYLNQLMGGGSGSNTLNNLKDVLKVYQGGNI